MYKKSPTPISELNQVLGILVSSIKRELDSNFVGAYLHGSFAIGDYTQSSDVDVLIVIKQDIKNDEIGALQDLHRKLFEKLPKPWGQRIELSYAPVDIIKKYSKSPRDPSDFIRTPDWRDPSTGVPPTVYPFWYLDNGSDSLVRSEHDNTAVVRWTTRQKGIVLAGPDPKTIIDEVTPTDIAIGNRDMLRFINREWATVQKLDTVMLQTFFVTLCVRVLHTLETGTVASKKTATEWALSELDSRWKLLIQRAWKEWMGSRENLAKKADTQDSKMTVALIRYTLARAEELSMLDV